MLWSTERKSGANCAGKYIIAACVEISHTQHESRSSGNILVFHNKPICVRSERSQVAVSPCKFPEMGVPFTPCRFGSFYDNLLFDKILYAGKLSMKIQKSEWGLRMPSTLLDPPMAYLCKY